MAGVSGSAMVIPVAAMMVAVVIFSGMAEAATYTVGDADGWGFDVEGWGNGKNFKAGDILVFKYALAEHNLVVVDKRSYDTCTVPTGAHVYESGNDQIKLVKGPNYFICGIDGHCNLGMKVAVIAN